MYLFTIILLIFINIMIIFIKLFTVIIYPHVIPILKSLHTIVFHTTTFTKLQKGQANTLKVDYTTTLHVRFDGTDFQWINLSNVMHKSNENYAYSVFSLSSLELDRHGQKKTTYTFVSIWQFVFCFI